MKMKNRTLIGIVCIVLAVAVTFLVSPLVNRISEQKTDVIRFTKDISHGSKIAETDIEILKASISIIGLLATSNQFIKFGSLFNN